MKWLEQVAVRQVWGGCLMAAALALGWFFGRDNEFSVNEVIVFAGVLLSGGIVFDTKAFVQFLTAIPWPWRRHAPEDSE